MLRHVIFRYRWLLFNINVSTSSIVEFFFISRLIRVIFFSSKVLLESDFVERRGNKHCHRRTEVLHPLLKDTQRIIQLDDSFSRIVPILTSCTLKSAFLLRITLVTLEIVVQRVNIMAYLLKVIITIFFFHWNLICATRNASNLQKWSNLK